MKYQLVLSMLLICVINSRRGIHHRHTHVEGAAIGPAKIRVYEDVPLQSPPGSIEHGTQYYHETDQVKQNSPEAYYNGGEGYVTGLPSYSVSYGLGGQRKALFPRVRGLRYYSRFHKKHNRRHRKRLHIIHQ